MSRLARIRRARRKIIRWRTTRLAFLGDENGNIRARIGKVWVRFPNGVDSNNDTLFSQAIPVNPGTGYPEYAGSPVRVGYDEHDEMYIKKSDEKELRSADYDLRMINPGNPQNKYFLLRHATRLICRAVGNKATTSKLVNIYSWIYQDAYGDLNHYTGTQTDADKLDIITGYTPSAAKHRVVIVFLRMIDQSLQVFGSTEQDQDTALDMTDYQECFAQSYIDEDVPIQAYKLADSQAVVDNRNLGVDLRMFLQGQPRFGEENPITHNRVLRSGQTEIVTDLNITGELVAFGEIFDLDQDSRINSVGGSLGDAPTGNYSLFEDDGTLRMEGDATTWEDVQFPISFAKVPAANFPTWETFTTNTKEYGFAVDDYIDTQANEMPHSWKLGTTGKVHLHVTTKAANATGFDRFAKFTIWVAYADGTGIWQEVDLTAELTISDGTAALQMFYHPIGDLTLTGFGLSTEIKLRVKRIAATGGTEYAGNIFLTQAGIHYESDTIGSRAELTK